MKRFYKPIEPDVWSGRIDDPNDPDAFRWHQVIRSLDLNSPGHSELSGDDRGCCFLGYSCDLGVKRNKGRCGAARGPLSIRTEMANLACHFPGETILFDAGDILCTGTGLAQAQDALAEAVERILALGLFPILLGGGHDIAFGHYKGIAQSLPGAAVGIVNFDAHFDLRPFAQGGSSGSPFLQIAHHCSAANSDFSYFCLGVQTYGNTRSLFKTAELLGVEYILAKEMIGSNLPDIYQKLDNFISRHDHIYLTICADVFSSAFAPGVSAPQPLGLQPDTVLEMVKHIIQTGKTVSFDIAEVAPRFDDDNQTAKLAAIVIYAVVNALTGRL